MAGRVIRMKLITREIVKLLHPNTWFVFGDNLQRSGLGGQAREMREEPNAFGIITKWAPSRNEKDYFKDSQWAAIKSDLEFGFDYLESVLKDGKDVVIPEDGIGTGLADLPKRAPKIFAYIQARLALLEEIK